MTNHRIAAVVLAVLFPTTIAVLARLHDSIATDRLLRFYENVPIEFQASQSHKVALCPWLCFVTTAHDAAETESFGGITRRAVSA